MKYPILILLASLLSTTFAHAFEAEKFFTTTCATCHTIGEGDKIGPDLAGLSKRRKVDWIVKFIQYPTGMIEGDPEEAGYEKADPIAQRVFAAYKPTTMPEQEITKEQVELLLKFIDSKGKAPKGKIVNIK